MAKRQSWKGSSHPRPLFPRLADSYRGFRRNASHGNWIGAVAKGGPSIEMIHRNRRHREDGKDYF